MNVFLGILAIIAGAMFGVVFSKKFKLRYDFYCSFNEFNTILKNEILYTKNSILNIIKNLKKDDFYEYIQRRLIEHEENLSVKYLSVEENTYLSIYLNTIGKSDVESQLSFVGKTENYLNEKIKILSEEFKRYKNVYVKIGFMVGLVVLVILL